MAPLFTIIFVSKLVSKSRKNFFLFPGTINLQWCISIDCNCQLNDQKLEIDSKINKSYMLLTSEGGRPCKLELCLDFSPTVSEWNSYFCITVYRTRTKIWQPDCQMRVEEIMGNLLKISWGKVQLMVKCSGTLPNSVLIWKVKWLGSKLKILHYRWGEFFKAGAAFYI